MLITAGTAFSYFLPGGRGWRVEGGSQLLRPRQVDAGRVLQQRLNLRVRPAHWGPG